MLERYDRSNVQHDIVAEKQFVFPKGKKIHWHAFYEIEIVMDGEGISFCTVKILR